MSALVMAFILRNLMGFTTKIYKSACRTILHSLFAVG